MLNEEELEYAKNELKDLKSRRINPNKKLIDMAVIMLYAVENIEIEPNICENVRWNAHRPGFLESLSENLRIITSMDDEPVTPNRIQELTVRYKVILDHHFWNDVDPVWCHESKGYYGESYGEDVLLKLIVVSRESYSFLF